LTPTDTYSLLQLKLLPPWQNSLQKVAAVIYAQYLSSNLLVSEWSVAYNEPRLGYGWCSRADLATFTQTNASHT